VDLPRPQPPVDPNALSLEITPPPVETEAPPPSRPSTARGRPAPSNQPAPHTETTPPAAAATPPAVTTEPAVVPTIQEIIPPLEAKRLQEQAQARRKDVQQILDQLNRGPLNGTQRSIITNINSFIGGSNDAEKRGDMKTAAVLADRAQVLARELLNGK
jgi:hypothetical protein